MEITISLPDNIAEQIQNIPDMDDFIATIIQNALENRLERHPLSGSEAEWDQNVSEPCKTSAKKSESDEFYGIFAISDKEHVRQIAEDKDIYYDL